MNYYDELGVKRDATRKEIKTAYLKLSKKFHPDKKGGDTEKFKLISAAYEVLKDSKSRKHYDETGARKARETTTDDVIISVFSQAIETHDFTHHNIMEFLDEKLTTDRLNLVNAISIAESDIIKFEDYNNRIGYKGEGENLFLNVIEAKIENLRKSIVANSEGMIRLKKIRIELNNYFDGYGESEPDEWVESLMNGL